MSASRHYMRGAICSIALFVVLLLWPQFGLLAYYFEAPLFPVGDFAANDLLVVEAKRLALLHGHYSRMGFFHPGPYFLYAFALVETLFVDLIPVFGSTMAAHAITATFLASLALALYFLVWFQLSGRLVTASLATGVMMACLALAGTHYLTAPWMPAMLVTSMVFLLTGLMGWYLLNSRWILLALFGALQLIHGHASFLGLLPLMLVVTAGVLGFRDVWRRLVALESGTIIAGAAISALFLAPLLLNTLLHWPGDWLRYLQQAETQQAIDVADKMRMAARFLAFGLAGIALLYRPAKARETVSNGVSGNLARVSAALFVGASASLLLLVIKAVDDTTNRYLLFWFIPAGALFSAAGLYHVLSLLPARISSVCALVLAVLLGYIAAGSVPFMAYNVVRGSMLERVYRDAKQLSVDSGKPLRIALDKRQNPSALWQDTLALLARMKRDDRAFACIEPQSWHISFTQWAECSGKASVDFLPVTLVYVGDSEPGAHSGKGELKILVEAPPQFIHRATSVR